MAQQKKSHQPFPDKAASKPVGRTSGDLIVMGVLVGVSRALFGRKKSPVQRTLEGLGDTVSGHRGRLANKPSEIPAKGWKDMVGVSTTGFRTTASCSWPLASHFTRCSPCFRQSPQSAVHHRWPCPCSRRHRWRRRRPAGAQAPRDPKGIGSGHSRPAALAAAFFSDHIRPRLSLP